MEEIWKPIKGYEGLYEVSSFGNVRSLDRTILVIRNGMQYYCPIKGKLLRPLVKRHGYLGVQLYGRGGHKTRGLKGFSVHRLVAETFIPNPNNLPEVNHIDEDKTNNRVDNLEWITHIENSNHGTRGKRIASQHFNKSGNPIVQIDKEGKIIGKFVNAYAAERKTGISHRLIYNSLYRKNYGGGYMWRKATEISE